MTTDLHPVTHVTEKDVFGRLEKLERAVYVPIVAGEVTQWLESVGRAIEGVEDTTCEYFRTVHTELFQQISELDPEQNTRVQALDHEDDEICARLQGLVELAGKLTGAGDHVEPDEGRIATATKELSDRTIALVLRIRKHETEISTWHAEALLRDRGPVD